VEIGLARFITPPLSSREYDAASAFTSSGRRTREGCCQPDYLVSFPGKPDLHLSLQVSRALFWARTNLLTGRFGRSFPIEPRRAISPSPGLPGFSHWSRVLWVTAARSNFPPDWRV
jgi:hypothetical protein